MGVGQALMHILSGVSEVVVVEAHSKASDVVDKDAVESMALDPSYTRPLGLGPIFLAGLEMSRVSAQYKLGRDDFSSVVSKNKRNALLNPNAVYGANLEKADVSKSEIIADPLRELDVSPKADGSVVLILSSAERARKMTKEPVWVDGISWFSDTCWVEDWDFLTAKYAALAAQKAYKMAGVQNPARFFDFAEIDDTYSYKEIQHLIALRLVQDSQITTEVRRKSFERDGRIPVNPYGGSLGMGNFLDATGAVRLLEAYLQLKGQAGSRQLPHAEKALVQSWRGLPTASGAVAVLSN
jgi:acetyl-CoA C-acetyltransferase